MEESSIFMKMSVYRAYQPAKTELKKTYSPPIRVNIGGNGIFSSEKWINKIPEHIEEEYTPEKTVKYFQNELDCIKFCVKNGYKYEEVKIL